MCPIDPEETLSRYVFQKSLFRPSDNTVKPEAFMPYKWVELSVTRHRELREEQVQEIGQNIAAQRELRLYGRAVCQARDYQNENLSVISAPTDDNTNHANVTGWPEEKSHQKMIAIEIAKAATFIQTA